MSKKKKTVKSLKKKLWKIFSLYIRKRDKFICITCGGVGNEAGHFRHRVNSTYFNEQNVNCQCTKCNCFHHGELGVYAIELDKKYGPGTAEKLVLESKKIKKFTVAELEDLIKKYKELE